MNKDYIKMKIPTSINSRKEYEEGIISHPDIKRVEMASKIALLALFVGLASCNPIEQYGHSVDDYQESFGHGDHKSEDYHSHPKYEYNYQVKDEKTGDEKSHQESRDGDTVRGVYTVVDPDGHKRIVEYTADAHSGFNAVVRREPIGNFAGFHNHEHQHEYQHQQEHQPLVYAHQLDHSQEYESHDIHNHH